MKWMQNILYKKKRRITMKHKGLKIYLVLYTVLLLTTILFTRAFASLPEGVPSTLEAPSIQKN
jgi:hypothetical protein